MPNAAGHQVELPEPDPLSFDQRLVPGMMLKHRLDLHGIDSVMKAQDMQLQDQARGVIPPLLAFARSGATRPSPISLLG